MKTTDLDNPVRFGWLAEQQFNMCPAPYLSGAIEARKLVEQMSVTQPLASLTDKDGGIYHSGRSGRRWVSDREHGVPFFSSTDILEADYSHLPLIANSSIRANPRLIVRSKMTLITRSGRVGRVAFARPDIDGFACSEDLLRVVPSDDVEPGYLYAYLSSPYGVPMVTGAAYGAIIQHIEPHHIADLPVPRFGAEIEGRIHALIEEAAELRARFQRDIVAATEDLFTSAGLPELIDPQWHRQDRDLGFTVNAGALRTLRALNYAPRARRIIDKLASVPHRTLGDICSGGMLGSGVRFKRIDAELDHGGKVLIGQRQGFWLRPEGRVINPAMAPPGIFAEDETVMIAAQGTLGENEVFGRPIFVTGSWLDYVYSQHFLRVVAGDPEFPGAYLFAFLRSEAAFRILRSLSAGSKQQDIHEVLRRSIPVPECPEADRRRVTEIVRAAYRARDDADRKEDQALALLDEAVRGAL